MQTEDIIKFHNKVRSSMKGNASQGAYEFFFTKNFASQGADKRGEGMLVWRGGCVEGRMCGGAANSIHYTECLRTHVHTLEPSD
jgi:hypothetical protein